MPWEETQTETTPHHGLAASFGEETQLTSLKPIDEILKNSADGTIYVIGLTPERDWITVQDLFFRCNPLLFTHKEETVRRQVVLDLKYDFFQSDPEAGVLRQILRWWSEAVKDEDIREAADIDLGSLAASVERSRDNTRGFLLSKTEQCLHTIVDVGIIRYPDLSRPYLKLYRLEAKAISDHEVSFFYRKVVEKIEVVLSYLVLEPTDEYIGEAKKKAVKAAIEEVDMFFT